MLAFGYTADEVATVYEKFVPKVMTYCMFDCWWYIGNVFRSKYRNDNLVAAAEALFSGHKYEVLVAHLVFGAFPELTELARVLHRL